MSFPVHHVYPANDLDEHDTDGRDCWCHPKFQAPCSQCDGGCPGCWECGETGLIDVEPGYDGPLIVIHYALDGRDSPYA